MIQRFDAIVIGTGQAGPPLAVRLGKAGQRTAIIERHLIGGTCVNTGCIPTKTLIASARAAYIARRGADFGVMLGGDVRVDMGRVKTRKDGVVQQSNHGVEKWITGAPNVTLFRGHARFEDAHRLRIGNDVLEGERIFINVGGRASVPPLPGLDRVPFFTNSSMMGVDFVPEHLIIVGGSYIGLEFAQMYRRFGSRVTVVEMSPRLVMREDEDVSAAVQGVLEAEGVDFRLAATCLAVERDPAGVAIRVGCDEEPRRIAGSHLLLDVGRLPNTADLGLDKAGVATDGKGYITVDEGLRTSVPHIWALGDVNGRGAFTHTSYNDYEIVAANLLDGEQRKVSERIPCYALFIDPPLGRVGMTMRDVAASGRKALVAKMMMTRVGRARERGETQGFMRVLVDAETKRILGASLLGTEGDEAVHSILDVMAADAPYTVLQRAMHIHPTVSELLPTLLGDLQPLGA